MELAGYFPIVRRWWLLVLVAVAIAAAGGNAVASRLPKVYEAEVRVLVGPLNTDLNTQRAAGQIANTYAQVVTSDQITAAVIQRLGLTMPTSALKDAIDAVPNDVTRILVIKVQNGDPGLAANLANAVADQLGTLGAEAGQPAGKITIIDPAERPTAPVAPQVSLIILLAAFAGLLVAISGIVLIEYVRDSVRSEHELRDLSGAPVLGRLTTRLDRRYDFASALLRSRVGESYRAMSVRIERSIAARRFRTVLITGLRDDGTAGLIAAGLALAFADRRIPTGLVDGNLHHPDATNALGLGGPAAPNGTGGSSVPMSRVTLVSAAGQPARNVELTVVPSGTSLALGQAQDLTVILDRLKASAELVVISAPPIDRSPEALLWAPIVDGIVMVVPLPGAHRAEVTSGVETLRIANLQPIGTIVTEANTGAPRRRWSIGRSRTPAFQKSVVQDFIAGRQATRSPAARRRTSSPAEE